MNTKENQTLEQKRAQFAYTVVKDIVDNQGIVDKGKFKSLVKKAPTLILTNGLGNTLAYLFSKGNNEHLALAYIIGVYIFRENEYTKIIFKPNDDSKFLKKSVLEFINLKKEIENLEKEIKDLKKEISNLKNNEHRNFNNFREKLKNKEDELKNKEKELKNKKKELYFFQNNMFNKLIFTDTQNYILATEETLRLLNWLKRFVEAMIESEEQ